MDSEESQMLRQLYDKRDMWNNFFIEHIAKLKTAKNSEIIKSLMITFSEIKTTSEKIGSLKQLTNEGLNN